MLAFRNFGSLGWQSICRTNDYSSKEGPGQAFVEYYPSANAALSYARLLGTQSTEFSTTVDCGFSHLFQNLEDGSLNILCICKDFWILVPTNLVWSDCRLLMIICSSGDKRDAFTHVKLCDVMA